MARILIAEDDALIAMHFELLLREAGHEVCGIAVTAPEAVAKTEALAPDLILMDGGLARGTSGLFATASIVRRWGTPVIFVSANVSENLALAAGAVRHLSKPVLSGELVRTVNEVLHRSAASAPPGPPRRANGH